MDTTPLTVVGIDPSTSIVGIGLVREAGRLRDRVAALASVRISSFGPRHELGVKARVWPVLRSDDYQTARIFVERPPPKARGDKKGAQAAIGQQQAWIGAWCAAADPERFEDRVNVITWRDYMVAQLKAHGLPHKPVTKVQDAAGGQGKLTHQVQRSTQKAGHVVVSYTCGHTKEIAAGAMRDVSTRCLACLGAPEARSRVMDVREAWKRLACEGMKAIAPDPYAALVADARSRVIKTGKADHQLVGVADASEAAWLALYGLDTLKRRRDT